MTNREFEAMLDGVCPAPLTWQPTDEELHRLFWSPEAIEAIARACAPPPTSAPMRPDDALTYASYRQQRLQMEMQNAGNLWTRTAAQLGLSAAPPPIRTVTERTLMWRIEVLGNDGVWYPVQGETSTQSGFLEMVRLPEHRKAQPHVQFRVAPYYA